MNDSDHLVSRFVMGGIIFGTMSGLVLGWLTVFGMAMADSIPVIESFVLASLCMFPVGLIPAITVGAGTGLACAIVTRLAPERVIQPFSYDVIMILTGAAVGAVASIMWVSITGDNILYWQGMIFLIGPITAGMLARGYLALLKKV